MTEQIQSPPLRFRLVDPATGKTQKWEDFFELGLQKPVTLPNEKCSIHQLKCYGSITTFGEGPDYGCLPVICQSTGLQDRDGREIFAGDVIFYLSNGGPRFFVVCFEDGGFCAYGWLGESEGVRFPLSYLFDCGSRVIGNRWEPAETLRQRAESGAADG